MADIDFDEFDDGPASQGGGRFQNVVNWAGALTSVALIAGLAVWGYKLTMRDVTGVPVVRALEGPMRVAPDNPGGQQAEHQGLAVNRVASDGGAEAPADRLVLAPRPVELSDEDQPLSELRPLARETTELTPSVEADEPAPLEETETVVAARLSQEITAPDPVAAALAMADQITDGVEPLAPLEPAEATATPKIIPASVPGLSRSLRPQPRPEGDLAAKAALAAVAAAHTAPKPAEVEPASVAAGTNLVQLGAFDSPEVARAEWQRLSGRFASFMEGKQRMVQAAESGGRTFYRLRATGFGDIADARRFCAALTAEDALCIPVVAR